MSAAKRSFGVGRSLKVMICGNVDILIFEFEGSCAGSVVEFLRNADLLTVRQATKQGASKRTDDATILAPVREFFVEADAAFDWNAFVDSLWEDKSDPVGSTLTTGNAADRFNDHHLVAVAVEKLEGVFCPDGMPAPLG